MNLKDELRKCKKLGFLTNEFATMAIEIASKRINKRSDLPHAVRDDALSAFSLKLVRKWELINPEKYPQNYINLMASSSLIDTQRLFKKDLDKWAAIEEKRKIEESFLFVAPPEMDFRKLTLEERASIKKGIIRLLKSGVSQIEISRQIHIPRVTLWRWEQEYKKLGSKFYRKDDRFKN